MKRLVQQTKMMEIPHLTELPSTLDGEYSLVVDAVFGFSFKPPMRQPFVDILNSVSESAVPIFSVDVPSGNMNYT
jgi:NAD(P)H-hydrate epimerase